MVQLSPQFHQSFTEKFQELSTLYEEVKGIVLLAEYENKDQKYIISSVNELRNMSDHIMRILAMPDTLDKNFEKAKGHLYRAGYDAYEIVAISKLKEIEGIKEQYKFEAITTAYPAYFKKVIPATAKAKKELIFARANKKIDNGNDEVSVERHFVQFENIATDLIKIVDDLNLHIDGISEAHKAIRKKFWRNLFFKIVIPTAIGLILLFIEYKYFTSKNSPSPQKIEKVTP